MFIILDNPYKIICTIVNLKNKIYFYKINDFFLKFMHFYYIARTGIESIHIFNIF